MFHKFSADVAATPEFYASEWKHKAGAILRIH